MTLFGGCTGGEVALPPTTAPAVDVPAIGTITDCGLDGTSTEPGWCGAELGNGYVVLIYTPVGRPTSPAVVVDAGGPVVDTGVLQEALGRIVGNSLADRVVFAVSPPEPLALSSDCRKADSANRAAVCDFDAINELYTVEYARVVELIRQTRGRGEKLDLLGTSFAASRWAQLIDREIAPAVGRGVIVSPLLPGVSGSRLDAATKSMADRMFAASLSGCVELECYGEIDLNEPSCEDSLCPSVLLSEMTGMEVSAVSEGLAGLMPLVEENGPLVARLVNEMDVEGLRGAMEQGRESYLWLDEFGDIHRTGVHVLGAICPTVTADRETPEPYRSCSSVPHLAPRREGHSQDMFDEIGQDNPFNPDIMCFVLTQPDTVIGLASTEGSFFGKSSFSDTWFDHPGHGDLALGAEVLLDFISSPGQSCQSS